MTITTIPTAGRVRVVNPNLEQNGATGVVTAVGTSALGPVVQVQLDGEDTARVFVPEDLTADDVLAYAPHRGLDGDVIPVWESEWQKLKDENASLKAKLGQGEEGYLRLMEDILENGTDRDDRTGTGTRALFGKQLRFDLQQGFPAVTTKRLAFKTMAIELLWFISGDTNAKTLQEQGCKIWDEWAPEDGDLGPVYGKQWRRWQGYRGPEHFVWYDQLARVIEDIKTNPNGRRHIVSAWNVADIDRMALPPCHLLYQFFVADGKLSCSVYQRSADMFLGVPFNIASYALLTHMVAQVCGLDVGELVYNFGDVHIYRNHFNQVEEQLSRRVRQMPTLRLDPTVTCIDDFKLEHIHLDNYTHAATIKAPVSK